MPPFYLHSDATRASPTDSYFGDGSRLLQHGIPWTAGKHRTSVGSQDHPVPATENVSHIVRRFALGSRVCTIRQASRTLSRLVRATTYLWQLRNKDKKESTAKIMNYKIAKKSPAIIAGITGLLFALLYTGLEILTENQAATHSISIWHTPLIWLLASTLFYFVLYAVDIVRTGMVKERMVAFSFSVVLAALLGLFWLFPMLATLIECFGGTGC